MDADIASTLSGFALGEVFNSLDLDTSSLGAVQSQLGIRGNAALNRDAIYADRFADDGLDGLDDDDGDDLDDEREDFEAMIDREMREEREGKPTAGARGPSQGQATGAGAGGAAGAGKGAALLRGEEDDFDEDYDEEEPAAGDRDQPMPDAEPRVKEEPLDAPDLYSSAAPTPVGDAQPVTPSQPADKSESQFQPLSMQLENLAPPPSRQVDVKELFPTFEPGKTLAFTDLFAMRPRKKRRVAGEGVKRSLGLSPPRSSASD